MGRQVNAGIQVAVVRAVLCGKMTIAEAAAHAGVHERTIRLWLNSYRNGVVMHSLGNVDVMAAPPAKAKEKPPAPAPAPAPKKDPEKPPPVPAPAAKPRTRAGL